MAELNLEYYSGKDLYSDGDIENEILEVARRGGLQEDAEHVKFPILYHLSPVRENILNWYPFDPSGTCLEIGSGCGAITRLLCQRLSKVVSVELSRRRAEINFTRNKDLPNLEIRVGNQNDMDFGEGFDYIILNGVFEYAMSFTTGERPYETFLENIKSYLKPDGILLIAIENRLGLKYFAGAPEDHTDAYFDGIREYEGNTSVRTFSRSEWEQLMNRCGLAHYRFYYPYPDYKFPKEIFTDESLKEQKYGSPVWNFTKYRMALFQEQKMAQTLQQEGIMAHFANSFLIEMSQKPLKEKNQVVYAKLSTDRAAKYSIATVIRQNTVRDVVKAPMTEEASAHMEQMLARQTRQGDYSSWYILPGTEADGSLVYPFLTGESLGRQAELALEQGDLQQVKTIVGKVRRLLDGMAEAGRGRRVAAAERTEQEKAEFRTVFGAGEIDNAAEDRIECIAPANIDLILDNIFEEDDGKYCVIDCEWIFDFPVPTAFLIWRAVNELYSKHPQLEKQLAKAEFLQEYRITAAMESVFHGWATHFAEKYVGANQLLKKSIPEVGVSLEEFRQRLRAQEVMTCQLFVDTGNGFSEEQKLVQEAELAHGTFAVKFDLSGYKGIRGLRFDPLEGNPCICQIDKEETSAKLTAANSAARTEQGDLFLTTDPIYQVNVKAEQGDLKISGNITVLSMEDALNRASQMLQKSGSRLAFWKR